MHPHSNLIQDLGVVLGVAALTTVVFRRLRQPVVLGYLLAGLIVGPYVPLPLFADPQRIQVLSELGVVLLMFSIGLELSVRKLVAVAPTAGVIGAIQIGLMFWLGYAAADLLGWDAPTRLYGAAMLTISSTMIIAKAFSEAGVRGRLSEIVMGVLIIEDIAAVLLLAILTAITVQGGASSGAVLGAGWRITAFLLVMLAVGFLVVPRAIRFVARLESEETLLVASVGICFVFALIAERMGYSVALGAFVAGALVAESGVTHTTERLVRPLRDIFAAVFFIAVGMLIDPRSLLEHAGAIALLTAMVILGKLVSVAFGTFITGAGVRTSVRAGMSMAQIGEFSFIIVSAGVAAGAVSSSLYSIAVAVSVITTFVTPWLIRSADRAASWLERHLPRRLQTFAALYESWLEQLRHLRLEPTPRRRVRRLVRLVILDAAFIVAIGAGVSAELEGLIGMLTRATGLASGFARWIIVGGAIGLTLPFWGGIIRCAGALGVIVGNRVLPPPSPGVLDTALAPRRALIVAVQLAAVLAVGLPLMAFTRPFTTAGGAVIILALALAAFGIALWRSAENLNAHVQAGAQMIVEALARESEGADEAAGHVDIAQVQRLLPGLGSITLVPLDAASPAAGCSLAQINLRAVTGATVLGIRRGHEGLVSPAATEVLQAGDVLVLTGSREAVEAAQGVLGARPQEG